MKLYTWASARQESTNGDPEATLDTGKQVVVVPGGCPLNRVFTRLQTMFIRLAPFALVAFLAAVSTLLLLDGMRPSPTLLGVLFGTQRRDHVLRPVQLLSPIIVLPLGYLAFVWSLGRGRHGVPTRVRLSLRDMMIWIAVVTAACCAGSGMWERRQQRMNLGAMCGAASRGVRKTGATYRLNADTMTLEMLSDEGPLSPTPPQLADRLRRAAHWDALKQKYERAAVYPWLPVKPDPPPP